ncbi:MAG: glycoside hydrolase family 3 C-terminal domain-containing protein [Oscillospiraceae bacterium]|nr:glycoside hydrolase family 3 C-terminal domain-containing protein [Oscillospiraceae bacterium]
MNIQEKAKALLKELTLPEKVALLSGADYWHTTAVERLGLPALPMADGPHGLRKQKENELGINKSYPATCFPTAALLACSWDIELATKQGELIGKEARSMGLSCVLGPGINIKRSPLCGRNFEYFSEDPLLSGKMGAGIVNGLQSQGVSACVKHFAVNNQENYRFWVDAIVDERTLREIYLASFEYALMHSKPMAMMCAYNKINGTFASENRWLLTDVLRNDWGYKGIVMSDWGAVNNRPAGVFAGLDLEMPGSFGSNADEIIKSVNGTAQALESTEPDFLGTLTEADIDICVLRMLEFILGLEHTLTPIDKSEFCDFEEHHKFASGIAAESMILLENGEVPYGVNTKTGRLLPLIAQDEKSDVSKKAGGRKPSVVVIGEMAENPVYQGGGSSRIVPTEVGLPLACIKEYADVTYLRNVSYPLSKNDAKAIKKAEAIIIFTGTPDGFDTEGSDRTSMSLPLVEYAKIDEIVKHNINTVTVVSAGAPVILPKSTALIFTYLAGQGFGCAIADLLFGKRNPCGKLAETFPKHMEDVPAHLNFPGDGATVRYGEGLKVGYRGVKESHNPPQYPFGYGLSYTEFRYSDLQLTNKITGVRDANIKVSLTVKNIGEYDGKEIVQLYIEDAFSGTQLKDFTKIALQKGKNKVVAFELNPRTFSYWDVATHSWQIKGGAYTIRIGDQFETITLESTLPPPKVTMYTQVKALWNIPNGRELFGEICKRFKVEPTEELVNTRDCSLFVGNMLKNMVSMFELGWSYEELQSEIDKLNVKNGTI